MGRSGCSVPAYPAVAGPDARLFHGAGIRSGSADLILERQERVFTGHLKDVECAPDIHPDPES